MKRTEFITHYMKPWGCLFCYGPGDFEAVFGNSLRGTGDAWDMIPEAIRDNVTPEQLRTIMMLAGRTSGQFSDTGE